jgi:phosphatidylinositol-bisphosphatase
LVIVGFQEMVDLNVQNAVSDAATRERSAQWLQLLERALDDASKRNGENEGYVLLAQKSLVGLMICTFLLKKHRPYVTGIQTCSVATGVMGVVGNKGACCVRFNYCDTSFCFVCAHLAAHTDAVDARNSDVRTINAKASFKLDPPMKTLVPEKHHSRIAATTPGALARGELLIKEHDYLVWLGDFNYRMDASNSAEEVFDRVNNRDLFWLRQNDQLIREMRSERVFQGLQEVAPISFLPSYKFEAGTDSYDRRPEKKVRAPAWTD